MPKSGTVILAGTIRVAPERLAELRPHLRAQVEGSRAEPGCLDYALSEDPLDPGLIRVFEHFVDEEALAFHRASPHMFQPLPRHRLGPAVRGADVWQQDRAAGRQDGRRQPA